MSMKTCIHPTYFVCLCFQSFIIIYVFLSGEKPSKLLVIEFVIRRIVMPFHKKTGGKKEKKDPELTSTLLSLPLTGSLGFVLHFLNNPIDMQVSVQVGGSRLCLWFVFRKQHVRVDGEDGEQSDSIIISPLFRYTGFTAEFFFQFRSILKSCIIHKSRSWAPRGEKDVWRCLKLSGEARDLSSELLGTWTQSTTMLWSWTDWASMLWDAAPTECVKRPLEEHLQENWWRRYLQFPEKI